MTRIDPAATGLPSSGGRLRQAGNQPPLELWRSRRE